MSATAISAIAISAPIIASNIIFSARRASRGIESMEENPLYGAANINIAGAQVLKGARAIKSISAATGPEFQMIQEGSSALIKKHSPKLIDYVAKNPVSNKVGKVLNYTAKHVNPVIVGTSALNIASSEDKVDTWARESTSLLTMFGAEAGAKKLLNLDNNKNNLNPQDNKISITSKKFAKKVLNKKQYDTVKNFMNNHKQATKFTSATGKGLLFAGGSIVGYKIGNKIADTILGEKETS